MAAGKTVPAAPTRGRSNHFAKPGPRGHDAHDWYRSTSSILRKVCRKTSRINDQARRQANLLIPLNLISDQALRDIVDKHGDELPVILRRLAGLHRANECEAQLIVSTAHKAKGREFETVIVLEDFELPSDLAARRARDMSKRDETDQAINLLYVAYTRATGRLMLAGRLFDGLR